MSQQLPQNTKWNDNRKTDAFKSTRKMYRNNKNSFINTKPSNTRVWRDKTSPRINNSSTFKNKIISRDFTSKQWKRDSPAQTNNSVSEQPVIRSKWTAERPKKDTCDGFFQRKNILNLQVDKKANVPEKKSFNKKIVIIKKTTRNQLEAEKKAIYDSFIKESFILKVADHLGSKRSFVETSSSDSWDFGNETCIEEPKEYLDDFDKWEMNLFEYVDNDTDDYEVSTNKRDAFFTGFSKSLYDYYKLPENDNKSNKNNSTKNKHDKLLKIEYMNEHKRRLKRSLMGLSVLPAIMVEDTQENIEEAYDSLYEFMISKRMKVNDISFEYDINHLLEISDKELRREFNKLRKKYNSIKKIQNKLENKEQIHKNEQDKYDTRHECIFLYHRLRYYDKYYMDGKLNFVNNVK